MRQGLIASIQLLTAGVVGTMPGVNQAWADAATHRLEIVADTLEPEDCGRVFLRPNPPPRGFCKHCRITATLYTNPGAPASRPKLAVLFRYGWADGDNVKTPLSFQFEARAGGQPGVATQWIHHHPCAELNIFQTEIGCLDEPNGTCRGRYSIQIPAVPELGLADTTVEAK